MSFSKNSIINGTECYTLTSEPSNKNAGTCQWATCTASKTKGQFFIKKYLSPKGPSELCDDKENQRRLSLCDSFTKQKLYIFNILRESKHNNILAPHDFFQDGHSFYVVYPLLTETDIVQKLQHLENKVKIKMLKSIMSGVVFLHKNKLVHSDIKLTNLILTEKDEIFLIDYDSAYSEKKPNSNLEGDFVYLSPEMLHYSHSVEENRNPDSLTCKSDIFSLGILFYRFFELNTPNIQIDGKLSYLANQLIIKPDYTLQFTTKTPDNIQSLIQQMVHIDYNKRPTAEDILVVLTDIIEDKRKITIEDFDKIKNKISQGDIQLGRLMEQLFTLDQENKYYILQNNHVSGTILGQILSHLDTSEQKMMPFDGLTIKTTPSIKKSESLNSDPKTSKLKMGLQKNHKW